MALQLRRGSKEERLNIVPLDGELVYDKTDKRLYVGDGVRAGGNPVGSGEGGAGEEEVQDIVADMFVHENHSPNLTAIFNEDTRQIELSVSSTGFLIDDPLPQLGEDLDLNGNNIIGLGNIEIAGSIESSIFIGDFQGNLLSDDSTILIDTEDRIFFGSVNTGSSILSSNGIISNTVFNLGTPFDPIPLSIFLESNLQIRQSLNLVNEGENSFITITQSRGTIESPEAVEPGDEIAGLIVKAYTNSSTSAIAGGIVFVVDPDASIVDGGDFVKSKVVILASSDTSQEEENSFILDSEGTATSNSFNASKYFQLPIYEDDVARLTAIPNPDKGMMIFMENGTTPSATNQMQVFNGTNWVNAS
jgi:hypothetical protein